MPLLVRAVALLALVMAVVGSTVVGFGQWRVDRVHHVAPPPIARATDAAEIARGGRLFRSACLGCHAGADDQPAPAGGTAPERRPLGARVLGAPDALGALWAPNLTADRDAGVGALSDGELARLLRNGLRRDGRYASGMPRFGRLSDQDVAALIGFLRSGDPLLAPSPARVPATSLTLTGKLILAYTAGIDAGGPARVEAPPRGPSADYGGYLARAVYGCVECHTDGFEPVEEKLRSKTLLAGGMPLATPRGEPVVSRNLTPDRETGLGDWTEAELSRALIQGIGRDGLPLRPPMPRFRFADADEVKALRAYLASVPPVRRPPLGRERQRPAAGAAGAELFTALGCPACHGAGAPQHDLLAASARAHAAPELAALIRNPEGARPGSQMPTYSAVIDDQGALRLTEWLRAGGLASEAAAPKAQGTRRAPR